MDARRSATVAAAGVGAAAAALGAGELVAAVLRPSASPLLSVGSLVVDLTPAWLKDAVIGAFGTGDKAFLLIVLPVLVLGAGTLAGVLEVRRPPFGQGVVVVLGAVAGLAAVTRSRASLFDVAPSLAAVAVGVLVLRALVRRQPRLGTAEPGRTRRAVLVGAGVAAATGVLAGLGARSLTASARGVQAAVQRIRLPRAAVMAPPVPAGAELDLPGLAPLVTPNAEFYRIDIALSPPAIAPESWALEIVGLVERPLRLTYRELLALPMAESRTTLTCVSNEVGGDLLGTALWLGHPLRDLLARARPHAEADMVLSTGADGFTASTPLAALTDARNAVLAVGMNGAVLPELHGFPVRMVVPGLYGYVSATKWLTRLEVTRFDRAAAYWTSRGYSDRAPVKLSSRIDTPLGQAPVRPGRVVVAGTAWSQHVGVSRVQVQVDGGPWRDARLGTELSADTWRQWRLDWIATAGAHVLRVRATDARGLVQTARRTDVAPNGATGLHEIRVQVG